MRGEMLRIVEEVAGLSRVFRAMTGLVKRTQIPPSRFSWGIVPDGPTSATAKAASAESGEPEVRAARTTGTFMRGAGAAGPALRRPEQAARRTTRPAAKPAGINLFIGASVA